MMPTKNASGKRSARVVAVPAPGTASGSSVIPASAGEAHCAFCHELMVKRRRHRRYCSGRCRAAASFERRARSRAEELARSHVAVDDAKQQLAIVGGLLVDDVLAVFPGATIAHCRSCRATVWRRAGGGEVCVVCHPAPSRQEAR